MKQEVLFVAAMVAWCGGGWAQAPATAAAWPPSPDHLTMAIWPGTPPGEKTDLPPESTMNVAGSRMVAGNAVIRLVDVSTPTLTLYKSKLSTGAAIVVFPGGGYQHLAIDIEGTEVCDWINSIGVTCVLVKYRVPDSGPYPKSAAAFQDAQRAMGLVRQHAAEWGIDPHRIGAIGFSAGAYLSAALSNIYDKRVYPPVDAADDLSSKPDFSVVIYPGYLSLAEQNFIANPAIQPTAKTPPTFILQAEDDPVHVENSLVYFQELKDANVPAELHIYAQGGHGYGLRPRAVPIMGWPRLVEAWLGTIKVLPAE